MEEKKAGFTIEVEEHTVRIRAHYDMLSEAEKRIADFVMSSSEEELDVSAQRLGELTNTSAATVVRFCKALNFNGYAEFKYYLKKKILAPLNGVYTINRDDNASTIKQKAVEFAKFILDDTGALVDDDALARTIDAVTVARKIEIFGEGSSGGIAFTAANTFMNIGIPCTAHTDSFMQAMTASFMDGRDVAFGISNSGLARNTCDALMVARESGATTICITGVPDSPMTKYADIVLCTSLHPRASVHNIPSFSICQLLIINIIQTGVLVRNYDQLSNRIINVRNAVNTKTLSTS